MSSGNRLWKLIEIIYNLVKLWLLYLKIRPIDEFLDFLNKMPQKNNLARGEFFKRIWPVKIMKELIKVLKTAGKNWKMEYKNTEKTVTT